MKKEKGEGGGGKAYNLQLPLKEGKELKSESG